MDDIHLMVLMDIHFTIQQMVDMMGISYGAVKGVLVETLGKIKLSARLVPRMLTPNQNIARHDILK